MSNFTIRISGVGTHNNGLVNNVEQLAAGFVAELKRQGHSISGADVHVGGIIGLHPELQVMPLKPPEVAGGTVPALTDVPAVPSV